MKEGEKPPEARRSKEHSSQHILIGWASPKVGSGGIGAKLGTLKVTNQARNLSKRIVHAGTVTNLKADVMFKLKATKLEKGGYSEYPKELQAWSNPQPLSWYREGWNIPLRSVDDPTEEAQLKNIEELQKVAKNPLYLLNRYLRNETYDILPTGREAYLWLFFTWANISYGFTPVFGYMNLFFGKYLLKITIYSPDVILRDLLFECDVRGWNDFTVKRVEKED